MKMQVNSNRPARSDMTVAGSLAKVTAAYQLRLRQALAFTSEVDYYVYVYISRLAGVGAGCIIRLIRLRELITT